MWPFRAKPKPPSVGAIYGAHNDLARVRLGLDTGLMDRATAMALIDAVSESGAVWPGIITWHRRLVERAWPTSLI